MFANDPVRPEEFDALSHHRTDLEARNRLIEAYLPLVASIATRMKPAHVELGDLVGAGAEALCRAVDRIDDTPLDKLGPYFSSCIKGGCLNYLRDRECPTVRTPKGKPNVQCLDIHQPDPAYEQEKGSIGETLEDEGPTPEELYGDIERSRLIKREMRQWALERLRGVDYQVYTRCLIGPESQRSFAERKGLSMKQVRQSVEHIKEAAEEELLYLWNRLEGDRT